MALLRLMFIFSLCFVVKIFGEIAPDDATVLNVNYQPEVRAVLDFLNSGPVKVYNYRDGVLINAHKKADITEIELEVKFDYVKSYPELPYSENTLKCHGFVQSMPNKGYKVLGDIKCVPKNSIIEEPSTVSSDFDNAATVALDFDSSTNIELEALSVPEIKQSISLSNEAASSEAGEHFVAVRKNAGPCAGCILDLKPDVPGVSELINTALRHVETERAQKHALIKVLKVQRQIVSGVEYILLVEIAPTTCSKNSNDISLCPVDGQVETSICRVIFLQKPWISKSKHVISNNCTVSQEYVAPELPIRNDIDNEIEVNGGNHVHKPFRGNKTPIINDNRPNFDHIAESGVMDESEMNPERLADLESQIMFIEPKKPQPKSLELPLSPTVTSLEPQQNPSNILSEKIVMDDLTAANPTFTLYAETERPQFFNIYSSSPSFESQATEDRPENGTPKTEEAINIDVSTTVIASTDVPEQRGVFSMDSFVSSIIKGVVELQQKADNSSESQSSSSSSSEEDQRPDKNNSSSSAEYSGEDNSSLEDRGHEKVVKRAIRQLEKISPEEKGLVKDLADFAAAALDNIDDDNYRRIVLQILGAKKMIGDGTYYHLILRLGISHCLEDKPLNQNCREKLFENYTKICKVQVHIGEDPYGHPKVVKSQCQNIKKDKNDSNRTNYSRFRRDIEKRPPGAPRELPKDHPKVVHIIHQTLINLDAQSANDNKYKSLEVISATSQVVAGALYKIKIKVTQSDCPKGDDSKEIENCGSLQGVEPKVCDIQVWDRPWLHNTSTTVDCEGSDKPIQFQLNNLPRERRSPPIPGGESDIAKDDPTILKHLNTGLKHLDSYSEDSNKLKVEEVLSASQQVVSGVLYRIRAKIVLSDCKKESSSNSCNKLNGAESRICNFKVWDQPWLPHGLQINITCEDQNSYSYRSKRDIDELQKIKRQTVGGISDVTPKNSPAVLKHLETGLKHLDSQSDNSNKLIVEDVISATQQVVSGSLYRIKAKIALSDCKKGSPSSSCNKLEDAESRICDFEVWDQPWLSHGLQINITCENEPKTYIYRSKRELVGGQSNVDADNVEVQKYLNAGLKHLDSTSGHSNKLRIEEILSATHQVVSGSLYRIRAKIGLSDCKKNSETNTCNKLDGSESRICNFEVWDQPWLPHGLQINITCENEPKTHTFRSKRDVSYHHSPHTLGKDDHDVHYSMFKQFIRDHNKMYSSKKEFKYRFKVFMDNMKFIRLLNKYEQGTGKYGVTKFADITRKEFSQSLGLRHDLKNENEVPFEEAEIPNVELPVEFDWRKQKVVSEVKDQGQCGSCWAFSVTGNVEGQYAIKHGNLLEFSEQELVDCDTEDEGCNGGLMDTAYRVIEKLGGLETEGDYPYDAEDEKCHFNASLARVQLSGALNISSNETNMAKWLVKNGPISIAINANAMQFYVGGVSHPYKFLCNPKDLDHGVLVVGYGVHTYPLFHKTLPYWIVKNSWGKGWGEQGYYRVYRGDGTCGVNQTPSSAIVV